MNKLSSTDQVAGCYLSEIIKWGGVGKCTSWFTPPHQLKDYCAKKVYYTELFQELIIKKEK